MTELIHVFDGTHENFQQLVVENSNRGTVLVNYWTPGAGPCFKLWKDLEMLSNEYQGRFLLVNVNTDTQGALARENGITSVPTIKIYRQAEVVESIYGAYSQASLRSTIDKYVPAAQHSAIAQAIAAYQEGNTNAALSALIEASSKEPDASKLHAMTMKLLLREKRYEEIEAIYDVLPDSVRSQTEINTLRIHAKILHLAGQPAPAGLLDAKMHHAATAMVADNFELALDNLLQITRQDRSYLGGLPRKVMLVIFSLLGEQHALSKHFQNALREILH